MQCAKSSSIAGGIVCSRKLCHFIEGWLPLHVPAVRTCPDPAESISHLHDELPMSIMILFPAYCKASQALFFPQYSHENLFFLAFCMSDPFIHHDLFLIQNQVQSTTCIVHFCIDVCISVKKCFAKCDRWPIKLE